MHRKHKALDVQVEDCIKVVFGDGSEGNEIAAASICEDDVEMTLFLLDMCEGAVKVRELSDITWMALTLEPMEATSASSSGCDGR